MSLALKLFWCVTALELLLWILPSLYWRRLVASVALVALTLISVLLFLQHLSVPTALILVMSAYRVCNLLRLVKARINEKHLQRVSTRASLWIISLQLAVLMLWGLSTWLHISTYHLWLVLVYADLAGGLVLLSSAFRHLRTTRSPQLSDEGLADRDLPTLTVAIPARNETDELDGCLDTLVASNYPKLEILVLDDCSQNKRTPEIIRSYAHSGVRFVEGKVPEANWLAKNQAYQQLFHEANGELILFCGVDARFEPNSLRRLVAAMIHKKKSMISVIPRNMTPKTFLYHDSSLLQPMRYAWELALPRKLFRRPPVLSTCWLIKRDTLENAGGFAAVSRSIMPESYFARVSAAHDGYSFMQSSDAIGITSNKTFDEQRDTTIRTRYPQLHRRMELVLILTLVQIVGVIMPYVLIILAILGHLSVQLTIVSVLTAVSITLAYVRIVSLTYRTWLSRSFVLLPVAAVLDAVLLNYSMVKYEFFSVVWKGRNVCIPVMRVVDHLPSLD